MIYIGLILIIVLILVYIWWTRESMIVGAIVDIPAMDSGKATMYIPFGGAPSYQRRVVIVQ
jgi:hypothetical protein